MKDIRIDCSGSAGDGGPRTCGMTGITVDFPKGISYEHAKAYALAMIYQELERYGIDEALRNIGIEP